MPNTLLASGMHSYQVNRSDPENCDRENADELIRQCTSWQFNRIELDTELVINFSAVGETLADRLISASIIDVSEIRRSERSRAELVDFLSHDLRSPLILSLYLLKGEEDDLGPFEVRSTRIENNINLSLEMIDDLWLQCDPSLLERALVNIIGNSLKYSPQHTVVMVETTKKDDYLVFRVTDQSVGIAPEMMDSLFQRFKRDKETSQPYEGTGLGLALVAKVVAEHGGQVHASSPGQGTTIEVVLPLSSE